MEPNDAPLNQESILLRCPAQVIHLTEACTNLLEVPTVPRVLSQSADISIFELALRESSSLALISTDKMHGHGVQTWRNGQQFEGEYVSDIGQQFEINQAVSPHSGSDFLGLKNSGTICYASSIMQCILSLD
jgi:hypothetical protein